jgi:hypothetical protein
MGILADLQYIPIGFYGKSSEKSLNEWQLIKFAGFD